jgi:hypothetical protein
MKSTLRSLPPICLAALVLSGTVNAGIIDFPGGASSNSNNVAANDPAHGNVWTGLAESFTAQDPNVLFGFYTANFTGAAVGDPCRRDDPLRRPIQFGQRRG